MANNINIKLAELAERADNISNLNKIMQQIINKNYAIYAYQPEMQALGERFEAELHAINKNNSKPWHEELDLIEAFADWRDENEPCYIKYIMHIASKPINEDDEIFINGMKHEIESQIMHMPADSIKQLMAADNFKIMLNDKMLANNQLINHAIINCI